MARLCSAEIIILPPVIIYDGSQYIALYHCTQPQQAASFRNKNSKEPLSLGQGVKLGCWSVGGIWALDHSKGRLSTLSTYGQLGHQGCIVGHLSEIIYIDGTNLPSDLKLDIYVTKSENTPVWCRHDRAKNATSHLFYLLILARRLGSPAAAGRCR